jgi:hypothetical protein
MQTSRRAHAKLTSLYDWIGLTPEEMLLTRAERARSVANIRFWKSYLPADCVTTMVAMGWDLTT